MNISALPRHDIEEFLYDRRLNRYRWRSQSGAGQLASKASVFNRTRTYINEQKTELRTIGQRLIDGQINLTEFQRSAGQTLKNIHLSQAMLGRDGLENMAANDWLRVGRELQRQYYRGLDRENNRRYGLAHLSREIADGKVSDRQLLNRLSMYAESGKVSFSEAFKAANEGKWVIRRLGATDRHCAFCLAQAAEGPRKIEDVPAPGCCPQCMSRCLCSLVIVDPPRRSRNPEEIFGRRRSGGGLRVTR
ncbi:MAG: hypothetical protein AAFR31_18160 [Cyanobacteria bacterium J06627_8]